MKTIVPSISIVVASFALVATGACAQDWTQDFYVKADAGGIVQQNVTLRQTAAPNFTATFNPGARGDVVLGYDISPSWAAEFESGFMSDSMDKVGGTSLNSVNQSVDIYSVPILANIFYKIQTKSAWTPYLGVGAGGIDSKLDFKNGSARFSDTDFTFAYQAEAGVNYALSKNASVGVAYKFLGTADQRYTLGGANHITLAGVYIHGVFANFTWKF